MEHSRAQELLSEYLDGELDRQTQGNLEEHLQGCEECTREFESLKMLVSSVTSLRSVGAPPHFAEGVRQKIRRRSGSMFDFAFGLERKIPFEAISMVLLGILIAIYIMFVMLPQERVQREKGLDQPPRRIRDGGVRHKGAKERPPLEQLDRYQRD